MVDGTHIEITLRLWSTGDQRLLDEYLEAITQLLPASGGQIIRRITQVTPIDDEADVVMVVGFPNAAAITSFLTDPRRTEIDQLAAGAVRRSLITHGSTRYQPEHPGTVTPLREPDERS